MGKTLFISDTHLFSEVNIKRERLPFKSIKQQNDYLIERWNEQVDVSDTVEILGDFSTGTYIQTREILDKLNGIKNFTLGNHDDITIIRELHKDGILNEVNEVGKIVINDGILYHLTHYPLDISVKTSLFNIHGHIHSKASILPNQINVSVRSPILSYRELYHLATLDEIFDLSAGKVDEIKHYFIGRENSIYVSDNK